MANNDPVNYRFSTLGYITIFSVHLIAYYM